MPASTQPLDGSAYVWEISTDGGTTKKIIGFQLDGGIARSTEVKERTTKQSCLNTEKRPGRKEWTGTGSGLLCNGQSTYMNFHELHTLWDDNTEFDVYLTAIDCSDDSELVDEYQWTGKAFFSALNQTHTNDEDSAYDFTLEGTGALTQAVLTP